MKFCRKIILLLMLSSFMSFGWGQDCDENMFWSDCGLPFYCNPTCLNPDPISECDDYCEIGCFCNDGYIFSDGTYSDCILLDECTLPGNQCIINGEIGFLDCDFCCWDTLLFSWLGDGYCDQFGGCGWEGPQFDCPEFGYDCGDCDITWDGDDPLGLCFDCPDTIEGDLNFDGYINILDVVVLVNCIISNDCNSCFDINYDGVINIVDIILIITSILED